MKAHGKVAFITGASGGIGRECAKRLAAGGYRIALTDIDEVALKALSDEIGSLASYYVMDVTDRGQVELVVSQVAKEMGRIDVCFANAGIAWPGGAETLVECDHDEFMKVLDVDLMGVWYTVKACMPHIVSSKGYTLITASIYSMANGVLNAPYAISKAAVESMGRALRSELSHFGASAGVLYPGWILTPLTQELFDNPDSAQAKFAKALTPSFLSKPILPGVVAEAVMRGIERRAARIIVPRRWLPLFYLRGLMAVLTDPGLEKPSVTSLVRSVIKESRGR